MGIFFFLFCQNLVKSLDFLPKSEKFWQKFFEKLTRIFPQKFLHKTSDSLKFCVFRVIFVTRKKKKNRVKMSQPINPTWKVRLPIKQVLLLLFLLLLFLFCFVLFFSEVWIQTGQQFDFFIIIICLFIQECSINTIVLISQETLIYLYSTLC